MICIDDTNVDDAGGAAAIPIADPALLPPELPAHPILRAPAVVGNVSGMLS